VVGRALLFLDVDGTLLPSDGWAEFDATLVDWQEWQSHRNPRLARVDRTHGRRLLAFACDLVWATAWMHDANEVIAPLLGLPQLPVADLPEAPLEHPIGTLHWKTARPYGAAPPRRIALLQIPCCAAIPCNRASIHPHRYQYSRAGSPLCVARLAACAIPRCTGCPLAT
jgi:hypothetical protein